jgi:signal transduction histidine kinase
MFEIDDKAVLQNRLLSDIRPHFVKAVFENNVEIDARKVVQTQNWNGEVVYKTTQGKEFNAEVSTVSFNSKGRDLLKVAITDITRLKIIEADLRKAIDKANESANAKARFLSNMSHKLRTPLNGILGTTNLMQADSLNETQKQELDVLKFSSEHMLHLINTF